MEKYSSAISKAKSYINENALISSKIATKVIHTAHLPSEHPGMGHPIIPPISLSTNFCLKSPTDEPKYDYSRAGNYNRDILEATIATMEDAKYCCSFSSGIATITSIAQIMSAGDHALFFNDVYSGTNEYFSKVASKFNICFEPVDMQDLDLFKSRFRANTKMVFLETPSNPLMRIVDIKKIVDISKEHNSEIIVVVDNTFLTPVFQMPLNLGVDIVITSLTKYMNGHSDVLMGAASTNDNTIFDNLHRQQMMVGAVPSPFDCYMVLRGLRTLTLRMAQHQLGGLAMALFLKDHPKIERVLHPALFESPYKEVVASQMTGFSGMLSVYVRASKEDTVKAIQNLKYFYIAESLGGFESLVKMPSLMTHMYVSPEEQKERGLTDTLVRISVGLEDIYTLLEDFDQALNSIC